MKRIALILVMIAMTYGLPQGAPTTDTEGGGGIFLFSIITFLVILHSRQTIL